MFEYEFNLPNKVIYQVDPVGFKTKTIFPDGSELEAVAGFTEEDKARSFSLGYPDCWAMHRDHDLLHHIIAQASGWPYSMMLWMVANKVSMPDGFGNAEERMVFLVAKALNNKNEKAASLIDRSSGV